MTVDLLIDSTTPGVQLSVVRDGRLMAQGDSILRAQLPAGRYVVTGSSSFGDPVVSEEIDVEVSPARHLLRVDGDAAALIPVPGHTPEAFLHHQEALVQVLRSLRISRRSGALVVMHRNVTERKDALLPPEVLHLVLMDPGLRRVGQFESPTTAASDFAIWSARLPPGPYTLLRDGSAQLLPVTAGRTTVLIVPSIGVEVAPALAAMVMVHWSQSWERADTDALRQAENLYGFLRVGQPISSAWLIERALSHPDPMIRLLSTSQLLGSRSHAAKAAVKRSIMSLDREVPHHAEVVAQLRSRELTMDPITYPPVLLQTYRQLHAAAGDKGLAEGSYAEHAAAAMNDAGLWYTWSEDDWARLWSKSNDVPFVADHVSAVVSEDSAHRFLSAAVSLFGRVLRRVPLLPSASRWLSSRAAAWRSADLLYAEAIQLTKFGHLAAQLRRSTAAYALLRTDMSTLSRVIHGSVRVTSTVHGSLSKRLEVRVTEDASGTAASSSGTTGAAAKTISGTAVWAAVVVLVTFGILVIWMLSTADSTNEMVWQRRVFIYGSVEALVFAAAGALFGVQVKREQVAKAEQRATNSEAEAVEAKRSERAAASDAERGRAQAATIRGLAASAAAGGPAAGQGAQEDIPRAAGRAAGTGGMTSDAALAALRNVADELFPPMGGGS
jgi:hypothetical protein